MARFTTTVRLNLIIDIENIEAMDLEEAISYGRSLNVDDIIEMKNGNLIDSNGVEVVASFIDENWLED